jgi:hypothetical protein
MLYWSLLHYFWNLLLAKYEQDLLQKEHSGCAALLRDDKVWLFCSMFDCQEVCV